MANGELKQAQGTGSSPDLQTAKDLALDDAKKKLSNNGEFDLENIQIVEDYEVSSGYTATVVISANVVPKSSPNQSQNNPPSDTGSIGDLYIVSIYITPDVQPTKVPTPAETNNKTDKESEQAAQQQQITNITKTPPEPTIKNTPPKLKAQGQEKLAGVLNKKRSELKRFLIPLIAGLALALGIKYLGNIIKTSDSCPPPEKMDELIKLRNKIVKFLNDAIKVIDALSKILVGVGIVLVVLATVIKVIKNVRKAVTIALGFFPGGTAGTPGKLPATLSNLKDKEESIVPKLYAIGAAVAGIGLALALFNQLLIKLLKLLKEIDKKLAQCSQAVQNNPSLLTPISPILIQLEQLNDEIEKSNSEGGGDGTDGVVTYEGFILEIIEEKYSPTVTRKKGVAKNSQGIVLLETPPSFTTNPQVLIEQLKLIIDSSNLKAY